MADTDSSSERVAVLGGGQLGRMLGLAGIPLGLALPLPRPVGRGARRRRSAISSSVRSATRPPSRRSRAAPGRRPTSGRACRPTRSASSPPPCPCARRPVARGVAGPAGREGDVPRARHRHARVRGGRRPRPSSSRGRRGGRPARGAQDPPRRLRRQGTRRCCARPSDLDDAWDDARRRAADPRAVRAVRPRAVGRWPCAGSTATSRAGPWSRTTTRRHPPRQPSSGTRPRRRAPTTRRRRSRPPARRARLRRRARGGALRRRRRAARQRDRAAGAQLRPLDDRGRGDQPVREPSPRGARAAARLDRPAWDRARW